MNLPELAVLYFVVGTSCAVAVLVRYGANRERIVDAVLLVPLWPLYGPFLLSQRADAGTSQPRMVLEALRRADGTPLSALLPDSSTAEALNSRIQAAERKIAEIDGLLQHSDFSEEEASRRAQELERRGDTLAASMAQGRIQNIRRLRQLRDRFTRELSEVGELMAQLRVQAELVRLAGVPSADSRDLTAMIVARIDSLGAILDEDAKGGTA